jgi:hypothetical protein
MNARAAFVDQTVDPVDPRGARIVGLQGAADCVAALDDRERYGVKGKRGRSSTLRNAIKIGPPVVLEEGRQRDASGVGI